jgi:hypothetical protein
MTTTAVFAEMLVAGIEAMVWIALIVLAIAQPCEADIQRLAPLKDWVALITAILLAIAYGLGAVIDRVSDSLFDWRINKWVTTLLANNERAWKETESEEEARKKKAHIRWLRLQVLARGDDVTEFMDYTRSRFRVARATTINLALTTIAIEAFLMRCTRASPWQISMSVVLLASLTLLSAFAAIRIRQTHDTWLTQAATMRSGKHS